MPQSFDLQLWETPEGQVCLKESAGLFLPASQSLEPRSGLPLRGTSGYLLYSNQTTLPSSLLMRMTVLLSKPKATSTLFHLNCDKCRVTSGALQDQEETWDQGEQGQQCRSSAAINKAEEWAQVNCPVLLLCWNIAKGMLIAHTFSMAFLGYSDTTLYRQFWQVFNDPQSLKCLLSDPIQERLLSSVPWQ